MTQQDIPGQDTPGRESLAAYLDDHLIGAETGVRLFTAARRTWEGTPYEQTFARLAEEISDERDELESLIHALGYSRSKAKAAAAAVGAAAGKLGPLNPLSTGGGATGQLELEALQSLVRMKESLWRTLLVLAGTDQRFNTARLAELLEAARRQQEDVAEVMEKTAVERFLATQP